jgi:hypothetical protein
MASYFRKVPNFEYTNRIVGENNISDYTEVKNLFKRGKLREDIFGKLTYFTKYQIQGDERPDNVAYNFYNDSTLDWVILLSNNIMNIQSEWPMSQVSFDKYLIEKYGSYDNLYSTHHYETILVKNSNGVVIVPAGLEVPENYSLTFYDDGVGRENTITNITVEVTNYDYEQKREDEKRNIFVLKPRYLNVVFNDMDEIMPYKKGGAQYLSPTLKRGDNIKLYE